MQFIYIFTSYFISAVLTSITVMSLLEASNPKNVDALTALVVLIPYSLVASIIGSFIISLCTKSFFSILIYLSLVILVMGISIISLSSTFLLSMHCKELECIIFAPFLVFGLAGTVFSVGSLVSLGLLWRRRKLPQLR